MVSGQVITAYGRGTDPNKQINDEGKPNYVDQGEFGATYQAINNRNAAGVSSYTVQAGDTLQGVARGLWGDASQWYRIADLNGLAGMGPDRALTPGMRLSLPSNISGLHNTSETFKPYDPSQVVGDTTPNMPAPPVDDGCGILGQIIMIVVAIVVTVVLTVYGGPAGSNAGMTFWQAFAANAPNLAISVPAAIAGSAISQMVGLAAGIIDEFDWKAVAIAGLTAGVGGNFVTTASTNWLVQAAYAAANAAINNALTQGVLLITGLQEKPDWKGIAAAAVGGAAGSLAGSALGGTDFGKEVLGKVGTNAVTGAVRSVTTGYTHARLNHKRMSESQIGVAAFQGGFSAGLYAYGAQEGERADALDRAARGEAPRAATPPVTGWNPQFSMGILGKLWNTGQQQFQQNRALSAVQPEDPNGDYMPRGGSTTQPLTAASTYPQPGSPEFVGPMLPKVVGSSLLSPQISATSVETALQAVAGLDPNVSPLHAKLAAVAADTAVSTAERTRQINALIDSSRPEDVAKAFAPVPAVTDQASPHAVSNSNSLFVDDDGISHFSKVGGKAAELKAGYANEQTSMVKQVGAVLDAMRAGHAQRQQIENDVFVSEPAFNRAMIFLGAATSHAVDGVTGLATLIASGGSAAVNAAAFVASETFGLARDIVSGDQAALTRRANTAWDGIEGFGESVQRKIEGLKTIANFATNTEVAGQLGGFLKGIAADTTGTGWLLGGAKFLGELALAVATGGTASAGSLAGAVGGAIMPTSAGKGAWARGTLSFDGAIERFGQLAFHYRSAGEALQVISRVGPGVTDDMLMDAHLLAQAAPMAERSGVLYGHIRMAEQGWQRVADFKLSNNQGLDAAYVRVENGVRELAVLESKSGRASAGALGRAENLQQGTQDYIQNRLTSFLQQDHPSGETKDLARQFIAASKTGDLRSFVSFADQGRNGARLLQLPGTEISTIRSLPAVPWRNVAGQI